MSQNPSLFDLEDLNLDVDAVQDAPSTTSVPTFFDLKLVNKKIAIRFCEYKISNMSKAMHTSETVSISSLGMLFSSPVAFKPQTLMRIWVEVPDYWNRKSKHVTYWHTDAPTYFQVLARVASVEETNKKSNKYQLLCTTVNLEEVDEKVLNDYLGVEV